MAMKKIHQPAEKHFWTAYTRWGCKRPGDQPKINPGKTMDINMMWDMAMILMTVGTTFLKTAGTICLAGPETHCAGRRIPHAVSFTDYFCASTKTFICKRFSGIPLFFMRCSSDHPWYWIHGSRCSISSCIVFLWIYNRSVPLSFASRSAAVSTLGIMMRSMIYKGTLSTAKIASPMPDLAHTGSCVPK